MKRGEKKMRTPMVTRTFRTTEINALFVKVSTKETYEKTFTLPRTLKTEKDIIKACAKADMFTGDERIVTILTFKSANAKYVMSEEDFIANAKKVSQ
jgi:hypothetical protein